MSRSKKLRILVSLGAFGLVCGALASSGAAYGSPTKAASHLAGAPRSSSHSAIHGYTIAESGDFIISPGGQSEGEEACPSGTMPLGGGGDLTPSVGLSLSTSEPDGSSWDVFANNNTGSSQFFRVFAVCATAPASYSVVVHAVSNSAGTVTSSSASCPAGTVAVGGGFSSFSNSPAVSANGSWPLRKTHKQASGWQVLVANDSSGQNFADALAVCAKKPKGYKVVTGPAVTLQPGTDARATAQCLGKTLPTGGGVMMSASPPQLLEAMNSTVPVDDQWQSYENNGEASADSTVALVVCARK